MGLLTSICCLIFFIYLGLGFYAISREPHSPLNRIFLALTISAALWIYAYFWVFTANISYQWIWFWFKVSSLGWISLTAFGMHFCLVLTGQDLRMKKWMKALIYLPAAVEIILIYTVILPAQAFNISSLSMIGFISPRQSWFWILHTLYYFLYSIIMLVLVARWGRNSSYHREIRQAKIIVVGVLAVLCSTIITFLPLPAISHYLSLVALAAGLLWAGAILYAMIEYKLMGMTSALIMDDILARVTDMILLVDCSGHIMMANNKAADILGYSIDDMRHMPLIKIIPNEELCNIVIPNQNELTMEMEVDYQNFQGESIPVKAYFTSITDNFRDIVGILVIGQDLRLTKQLEHKIDEKDRAEAALYESEKHYRELFENANDVVYTHDLSGKFLSVNKAAENLLGYSRNELVYMNSLDVLIPELRQPVIDMFNSGLDEIRPVNYEVTVLNRQGERHDLEVSRRPILKNAKSTTYQCIARDVTERKRMEDKLKYLSMHDSMTGLYNRAYFTEELVRLESGRCDPVGIMICDLDDLKKVNDSIGHEAGDEMIITAAHLIQSCFRVNDVVARFGGDEFAIVLPYSNEDVCIHLADKIKSAVEEHNQTSENNIGISLGFAIRCSTLQKLNEVVKQADLAMYADKAERKRVEKIS